MYARITKHSRILLALALVAVVLSVGCHKPVKPMTLACAASPAAIYPGERVTLTAMAEGANPRKCSTYTWTGDGVVGDGHVATVTTNSLAVGMHTVKAELKECKPENQVEASDRTASCTADFVVKSYESPTVTCVANPSTIKPGDTATVVANGVSPQNRPLTFSYSASAGTVSGSGAQAVYSTAGAPTGSVAITCTVSDDKSQTATTNTAVTILAPYVAPVPHTQALCSVAFEKDKKRPTRVDNEAKACLDEVALSLQRQTDAKAVVVGEAATSEKIAKKGGNAKFVKDLAAQRAVNVKEYLVTDKGIDGSRVSTVTGLKDSRLVENYLVPSDATFGVDIAGTNAIDSGAVKAEIRKPLGQKALHKSKAKAEK